jgi:hypothetical protein
VTLALVLFELVPVILPARAYPAGLGAPAPDLVAADLVTAHLVTTQLVGTPVHITAAPDVLGFPPDVLGLPPDVLGLLRSFESSPWFVLHEGDLLHECVKTTYSQGLPGSGAG